MMKTKALYIITAISLLNISLYSQETFTISGTKFTYPLIEKWIAEYSKENPSVKIILVNKKSEAKIDISIIAHQLQKNEISNDQSILYVSRYALLPVTSKSNIYLKNVKKHGLSKNDLDKLFFDQSILDDSQDKNKLPVTIYSRENNACSALTFARYFGHNSNELRGKKIAGDDIYLLSSIKKDTFGVTFNVLANIYDQQTRKIKEGYTLLPLEINKEASNALNNSLDNAYEVLENGKFETIPVENVGFIYNAEKHNGEVIKFIKWVLSEGQVYNHTYGFLNLNKELISSQQGLLENLLLSVK